MRSILIIGILFYSILLLGDNMDDRITSVNDSLFAILETTKTKEARIDIFLSLADNNTGTNDSLALIYINKVLNSNPVASKMQLGKANYYEALTFIYSNEHSLALPKLYKAIEFFSEVEDEPKIELGNCYLNLARSNRFTGNYFKAIKNLSIALEYFEEVGDKNGIANCTNHIGIVYNTINNNDKAKEYYLKCQSLYQELDDQEGLVYLLNNLGYIEQEANNLGEALKYYNEGLQLAKSIEFDLMEVHLLSNLAHLHLSQNQFEIAEEMINNGLLRAEEIKANRLYQFFKLHQVQLLIKRDKSLAVESDLFNIIQFAQKKNLKFLESEGLKVQKDFFLLKGDFKKVYKLTEILNAQKDSLNSSNLAKETAFLDSKYKHESRLNSQKLDLQKDSFSKKFLYALSLFFILMTGMASYFVRRLKNSNLALTKQNKLLEEKDADLELSSQELEKRNEKLQLYIESNTQLEKFARATSHDIKTPLRTIASFAGLLDKSIKPKLNEKEEEYINHVIEGTKRLGQITNDLLNYSSVNGTSLNLEQFNFKELVENNIKDLAFLIQQTNTKVNIGNLPTEIYADKIKLRRVMQNLIENSMKYASPDQAPIINVESIEKVYVYEFIVRDNGVGIKVEDQEKVFATFSRVNKLNQGVGLGLSICKNNIEKHGGKIWINSEYKDGTEFRFTIPKDIS